MKNPYLRTAIVISLMLSFLSVLILVSEGFLTTKAVQSFDSIVLQNGGITVKSTSNMDWILVSLRIIELVILFPVPLISFALGGDEGAALFAGMMLASVGPVVTFIAWFIILYFITYLYARSKRKENYSLEQKSNKVLIISCILCVALFTVGQNLYFNNMSKKTFDKLIGFPVKLSSVSPDRAKEGDLITLVGSGFSKQEIYVWLVNKDQNKYGALWTGTPTNDSLLQFPLKFPLCNNAAQLLQNNCQKWENFSPGRYIIEIRGGALPDPSLPFEVLASGNTTQSIQSSSEVAQKIEVNLKVNGSHDMQIVKLNSPITVSWSVKGQVERCEAFGSFAPRADGKGFWGKGDYTVLPSSGSIIFLADRSELTFQINCGANIGKPTYISIKDSVTIQALDFTSE